MHNVNSRLTNYLKVFSFLEKTMNDRTNLSKNIVFHLLGHHLKSRPTPKNMFFEVKWSIISKNSHFLPLNGWHIWHNFAHSFPRVWSGLTPKICFVPWKRKMCHEKMWQNINHIIPTTYVVRYKITKNTVTPLFLIKSSWNFLCYFLQSWHN